MIIICSEHMVSSLYICQLLRHAYVDSIQMLKHLIFYFALPDCYQLTVTMEMYFVNYIIFMPPPFEEWWRGIKCYPCPCVRASVRPSVRYQNWCPLNNFWKTALIRLIFGMLMYNIKTQVKFDLGYNPLIFDGVMGLL